MLGADKIQIVIVFHENRRRYTQTGKVKDAEATIGEFVRDFEAACDEFKGLTIYDYEVYDAKGKRIGEYEQIGPYRVYLKILTYMPFDPNKRVPNQ